MLEPIVVVPHDPQWAIRFEGEREAILDAFGGLQADIEHIGSTSVPGLAAKPILAVWRTYE